MCLTFPALSVIALEPIERAGQIVFPTLLWHQQGKAISVC
jgi:hypothetical protein